MSEPTQKEIDDFFSGEEEERIKMLETVDDELIAYRDFESMSKNALILLSKRAIKKYSETFNHLIDELLVSTTIIETMDKEIIDLNDELYLLHNQELNSKETRIIN